MALSRPILCVLIAVAAIFAEMPGRSAPASSKLDRALHKWIERPTTESIRALVRARPGAAVAVRARLQRLSAQRVTTSTTVNGTPQQPQEVIVTDADVRGVRLVARRPPAPQ
jgi:hypothetical protein